MDRSALAVIFSLSLAAAGMFGAAASSGADAAPKPALMAGAARVDITPDLSRFKNIGLGGYGERFGKFAEGAHDSLYARALVLASPSAKTVIVSLDALMVAPGLKDAVMARVQDPGLQPGQVIICATHSHNAPENLHPGGDIFPQAFGRFNKDFFEWNADQIASAIRQAIMSARPARIATASAELEGLNRNRRGDEALDREMTVLSVTEDTPEAKPIAALVNFTAHPTMVDPAILLFSGEWPGEMSRTMEKALGAGSVVLFLNGAQGDQTHSGAQGKDFERVQDYGQRIAKEALNLANKAPQPIANPRIAVSADDLKLPPYAIAPGFAETTGAEYKIDEKVILAAASRMFPSQAPIAAIRAGDLVMLPVPGEMTAELALALKKRLREMGAPHPIIVGLANSYIGYIPSPRQYKAGGYEVHTSFYGENIGTVICDALASQAGKVIGKQD